MCIALNIVEIEQSIKEKPIYQMNENDGLISVIVPVYNVERYLDKCVLSIVTQTYQKLEIILVNDGSTDKCGEICDKWALKDNRIRVIHKSNGGLSDARNAGLNIASGEYIGFIDSDDYIQPDMYQKLHQTLKIYNTDLSVCEFDSIDENGCVLERTGKKLDNGVISKSSLFKDYNNSVSYHVSWNKLYHKRLFENIRFPYGRIYEDEAVMPQIYGQCNKVALLSDVLYHYSQRNDSITRQAISIKNYDAVEAFFVNLRFYEEADYKEMISITANQLVDRFLLVRDRIKDPIKSEKDKNRMLNIKRMVRYCYLRYWKYIRFLRVLNVEFPTLYYFLFQTKWKFMQRRRVKNSK